VTGRPKSSHEPVSAREPIAFVIDDDASMRRALTNLFQSVGLKVEVFGSAPEMLQQAAGREPGLRLPRTSRSANAYPDAARTCQLKSNLF
jgi:CheY-like chemotaxis protein